MDLGCGRGLTSLFLVKGIWISRFLLPIFGVVLQKIRNFDRVGLSSEQIIPLRVDANELPLREIFLML